MRVTRFLLIFTVLLLATVVWLWWTSPRQVEMAAYVPVDSLLYLELNNLPNIATNITRTDAWKILAADSEFKPDLFRVTWMSRLARWTGIGSAEQVILARAQFALVVMALEATDEQPTLRIRPVAALIIETHTTERRMKPAIERWVTQLARRVYPQSKTERRMLDGIEFVEWVSTKDGRRIVVAFLGSVAIVGNDARAVQACTLVRRGASPSLAGNKDLRLIRTRVRGDRAAAFGYISSLGLAKIIGFAAPFYFERMSASAEARQIVAKAAEGILHGAAWATDIEGVSVEDRYFVSLSPEVATSLREAFAKPPGASFEASVFLPGDTYSFTQYRLQNPQLAWRGLNRALSSHVDIFGAMLLNPLFKAALWPYGIDDPEAFLGAIGPEIVTTRLDQSATASVLIVQVFDEPTLKKLVNKRLGPGARTERVAPYEVRSSLEGTISASFAEQGLLLGPPELVRRCLLAKLQRSSLDPTKSARQASVPSSVPPLAVTYTRDVAAVHGFLSHVSSAQAQYMDKDSELLSNLPYSVSTTDLSGDGFEKTTRSTFGLLATLTAQIASELSGE